VRYTFLGVALIVANQSAFAQCLLPTEKIAFDVRALQTQLMIAAITCNQRDDYNRFVVGHQRDLADAYNQIISHFARVYGGDGQDQADTYITDIANSQSHDGIANTSFCNHMKPLFYQALTRQTVTQMETLVIEWNLISPYPLAACVK
jgi:hypothetical protein